MGANPLGVLYYYIDLQQNSNPFPHASMGLRAYFKTAATIWRMKNRRYLRRYVRRELVPLAKVDRQMYEILVAYLARFVKGLTIDELNEILVEYGGMKGRDMRMTIWEQAEETGRTKGRVEGIVEGRTEGIVEGRTEGKAEERWEVAQRLLRMNLGSDVVHKATGLTAAEIEKISHSLNGS